jgi:hypothetical protein
MNIKLSFVKGVPVAYIKSDDGYKMIYIDEEPEYTETKKSKKSKVKVECESCIDGGCDDCSENCDEENKCCNLCEH